MNPVRLLDNPDLKPFLKRFRVGDFIFRQGDVADAMYVILDGTVKLVGEKNGQAFTHAVLERGQFFGERAIFSQHNFVNRFFSAIAKSHCILLRLTNQEWLSVESRWPSLALELMKSAFKESSSRLEATNNITRILRSNDMAERFINLTLHFGLFNSTKVIEGREVILTPDTFLTYMDTDPKLIEACFHFLLEKKVLKRKLNEYFILPEDKIIQDSLPELQKHLAMVAKPIAPNAGIASKLSFWKKSA